jgi:hypothetical protein
LIRLPVTAVAVAVVILLEEIEQIADGRAVFLSSQSLPWNDQVHAQIPWRLTLSVVANGQNTSFFLKMDSVSRECKFELLPRFRVTPCGPYRPAYVPKKETVVPNMESSLLFSSRRHAPQLALRDQSRHSF